MFSLKDHKLVQISNQKLTIDYINVNEEYDRSIIDNHGIIAIDSSKIEMTTDYDVNGNPLYYHHIPLNYIKETLKENGINVSLGYLSFKQATEEDIQNKIHQNQKVIQSALNANLKLNALLNNN